MILRPVIEKILTFARKALFICEVVLVLKIETTMEDFLFLISSLVSRLASHLVLSLPLPQPREAFAVAGGETKETTPGRFKTSFVSVTFPHLIGISISLQLQAVLLAHVSDLT